MVGSQYVWLDPKHDQVFAKATKDELIKRSQIIRSIMKNYKKLNDELKIL